MSNHPKWMSGIKKNSSTRLTREMMTPRKNRKTRSPRRTRRTRVQQRLNSPSPNVAALRMHRRFQMCHFRSFWIKTTWGRVLLHRNGLLKTYSTFSGIQSSSYCKQLYHLDSFIWTTHKSIVHTFLIESDQTGAMNTQFGLKSACSLDCCNAAAILFLSSLSEDRTLFGVIYMGSTHNRCWAEKKVPNITPLLHPRLVF